MTFRRIRRRPALLTIAMALLLPIASAPAHAASARSTTQTALAWYDVTDATITAAGYPEPVTQSRGWAVSWLAAARAIGRSHDHRFATAARVWEGVHFRFSDTTGARVGASVADYDLRRLPRLGI